MAGTLYVTLVCWGDLSRYAATRKGWRRSVCVSAVVWMSPTLWRTSSLMSSPCPSQKNPQVCASLAVPNYHSLLRVDAALSPSLLLVFTCRARRYGPCCKTLTTFSYIAFESSEHVAASIYRTGIPFHAARVDLNLGRRYTRP